ncbi:MAG TPA: glycoside hydrolase domain-containing protein [Aquella sp.]|nr:glycoside hydrolase domain-containing protein [Aquella sp.]
MPYTAFDTADVLTDHVHQLVNYGITTVGLYSRTDRSPEIEIEGIKSVGVHIYGIYEKGNAIQDSYFTVDQAAIDAERFIQYAELIKQPQESIEHFCADYDSDLDAVLPYFIRVHDIIKPHGFLMGSYGNGLLGLYLKNNGYSHSLFLSQSTGFQKYHEALPHADIIQKESGSFNSFDVDWNIIVNPKICWV